MKKNFWFFLVTVSARDAYRLGDAFEGIVDMVPRTKRMILKYHTNSIASDYLVQNTTKRNSTLMKIIAKKHCRKFVYPENINKSIAIHLRTGDVICGTFVHEIGKRPFHPSTYEYLKKNLRPKYVFSQPFWSVFSSRRCVTESSEYIRKVLIASSAVHIRTQNADHAFCAMIKAQTFVQGTGFFSSTIAEMRKHQNFIFN